MQKKHGSSTEESVKVGAEIYLIPTTTKKEENRLQQESNFKKK